MRDERLSDAIADHVERHLGPIAHVWDSLSHVAPREGRGFHTLVTGGLSDRPMRVPRGAEAFRHAELLMCLPSDWPVGPQALASDRYWPMWWLERLQRFPHEYDTWLGWGHTVPNGDPPAPFAANTRLCCMLLRPPVRVPSGFAQLRHDDRVIHFYAVIPLHAEEMRHVVASGAESLIARLDQAGVTELLDPARASVA